MAWPRVAGTAFEATPAFAVRSYTFEEISIAFHNTEDAIVMCNGTQKTGAALHMVLQASQWTAYLSF